MKRRNLLITLAALFSLCIASTAQCTSILKPSSVLNSQQLQKQLEDVVNQYHTSTPKLPGLAIIITNQKDILFEHYSGYADLEQQIPVDTDTQFYLKSTTKSFLGLLAAQLHIEGTIQLNAPISHYLTELKLPAPLQANQISLQSHFTHTLSYHDAGLSYRTAYPGNLRSEAFLPHLNSYTKAYDSQFRYSNFGPIVGALALEEATGKSWKTLMEERIFHPLGMKSSTTSIQDSHRLSKAYIGAESGTYQLAKVKTDAQMHAAGGSVSSASDMALWLQANLNQGLQAHHGKRISQRAFQLSQAPLVQLDWQFLDFHRYAHGLGLYRADYRGETLLHHFGGETHMSFMPQQGLGMVILTNETRFGVAITHRLASSLYDVLLEKENTQERIQLNLEAINESAKKRIEKQREQQQQWAQRQHLPNTIDAANLIGTYSNGRLGDISISSQRNMLYAHYGELYSPLKPIGNDEYLAQLDPWGAPPYEFRFTRNNEGTTLHWGQRSFKRSSRGHKVGHKK